MVTRCVCFDLPLADLRAMAMREGIDAEAVMERTGCGGPGGGCGLCAPYIRAAIELGVDAVPLSAPATLEAQVRAARHKRNGPDACAPGPSVR